VVQVNGSPRATTFVSPTQLSATILASDLGSSGALTITVFTPAPGGGTSAAQALAITGPGVAVSATSVQPGGAITATISNSPSDGAWVALSLVGSPTNTYLQYTFVAAGVSNRTWDVIMPTSPGSYEFRLLFINTYTVAARSPVVSVGN
jgi:trimeric autotransporter adhesin